jgi:hypothetical protein
MLDLMSDVTRILGAIEQGELHAAEVTVYGSKAKSIPQEAPATRSCFLSKWWPLESLK